jgi:hypothetical protein
MKFSLGFISVLSAVWGTPRVEMYMEWVWEAKGQELFPLVEDREVGELGVFAQLRRGMHEKGIELSSWELERHRPELLAWSGVHSWADFWMWLFPKKSGMEETTWLFWSLGPHLRDLDLGRVPKENKVLMIFEPPTVQKEGYDPAIWEQFRRVITWDDDLVDGKKFVKYHYPVLQPRIQAVVPFAEKKFCCLFATRLASRHPKQLYSERERVIRFFEDKADEFDLFGKFWEKRGYKNWRGRVDDKLRTLKGYKFNICYENMRDVRGYVTEKMFDCLAAGVVPIYWGASNIDQYVPKECFIDRREFEGEAALYAFMKEMREEAYNRYLKAAEEFLKSEKAQLFSKERFVKTVVQYLEQKPSS